MFRMGKQSLKDRSTSRQYAHTVTENSKYKRKIHRSLYLLKWITIFSPSEPSVLSSGQQNAPVSQVEVTPGRGGVSWALHE